MKPKLNKNFVYDKHANELTNIDAVKAWIDTVVGGSAESIVKSESIDEEQVNGPHNLIKTLTRKNIDSYRQVTKHLFVKFYQP